MALRVCRVHDAEAKLRAPGRRWFQCQQRKSLHRGLEFSIDRNLGADWSLGLAGTYARHTYDFDLVAARGETFRSGNDIDTAPRWIGTASLRFEPSDRIFAELQLTSLGRYYLDAENRFSYPGHELLNIIARFAVSKRVDVTLRVRNVADATVADRADYAFGNYRYFPGRGREAFVELSYRR